jgi:hypothetical protein
VNEAPGAGVPPLSLRQLRREAAKALEEGEYERARELRAQVSSLEQSGAADPTADLVLGFGALALVPVAEGVAVVLAGFGGNLDVTHFWAVVAVFGFLPLVAGLGVLFRPAQKSLVLRAAIGVLLLAWVAPAGAYFATVDEPYTHRQGIETVVMFGGLPALLGVVALVWALQGMATRVVRDRDRTTRA